MKSIWVKCKQKNYEKILLKLQDIAELTKFNADVFLGQSYW